MARISRAVFFMVFIVALMFADAVRAQSGEAPAPAPMDAGAGSMVTYSATFVCSTLILSFLALLRD
ncbi:hypothetical protein HN51_034178 [Arachis hypogaea]